MYIHKNYYLKNRSIIINDYKEISGKNSLGNNEKITYLIKAVNILKYNKFYCYIYFDATIKFTNELKIKQVKVSITEIELKTGKKNAISNNSKDDLNSIVCLSKITKKFIEIYYGFKKFMHELKSLISDMSFLNSFS